MLAVLTLLVGMVLMAGCTQSEDESKPAQTEKELQKTSVVAQSPGAVRKKIEQVIYEKFPAETGYEVNTIFKGCLDKADLFRAGHQEGKLKANVLMAYGRTGELPEGTDIYNAW